MLLSCQLFASDFNIDEIKVYKSKHRMDLMFEGKIVKTYRVMLGRGGMKAKVKAGDKRVPEGSYILDYKNPDSLFYKSLHISYPNPEDVRRANELGVDPGGDIMIHGFPNKQSSIIRWLSKLGLAKLVDWTAGCVAVKNSEMDEIFENIPLLTPITIVH